MNKLKYVFIAAFVVPALAFGGYLAIQAMHNQEDKVSDVDLSSSDNEFLDGQAKGADKSNSDQNNSDAQQNNSGSSGGSTNTQKQAVSVIITDAGQYGDVVEVRAFIPSHLEEGSCTMTFRKGGLSVIERAPAYPDASSTICTNPEIKRSEFPQGGQWTLVVSYKSTKAEGQSEARNLTLE